MHLLSLLLSTIFLGAAADPNLTSSTTPYPGNTSTTTTAPYKLKNVMVILPSVIGPILEAIKYKNFSSRGDRLNAIAEGLQKATATAQAPVVKALEEKKLKFTTLWITNKILVENVEDYTIHFLESLEHVESVREEVILFLEETQGNVGTSAFPNNGQPQWNIDLVKAPQVWPDTTGEGVVLCILDTGVQQTHEALRDNFRGVDYGWYDPNVGSQSPKDINGHGTHVAGIAVGKGGIGVAPGSQWIACRTSLNGVIPETRINQCAQWTIQPRNIRRSNPDGSKAPNVVTCSFGADPTLVSKIYEDAIAAWKSGNIVVVFSVGNKASNNYGPECTTANYPSVLGDDVGIIAVGSINESKEISTFSSRGPPTRGNGVCPQIVAPGDGILSADFKSDDGYRTDSGTSMAAPHVAGAACLLLSKTNGLDFEQVKFSLVEQADQSVNAADSDLRKCGDIPADSPLYPNNAAGWGILDCFKALNH